MLELEDVIVERLLSAGFPGPIQKQGSKSGKKFPYIGMYVQACFEQLGEIPPVSTPLSPISFHYLYTYLWHKLTPIP